MIIPVGIAASGLDIFLRFNNVLADPLSISYQIFEPSNTVVASGSGFKRSVGHYDARNSIIPSGYDTSSSWTIVWDFVSPANVSGTASEEFTVVDSLTSSFTNVDSITEQIKLDLGIADTEFTDAQFETFIIKALNKINLRLCLSGSNVLRLVDGTITPAINESGQELILLAVECLVQKRKRTISVNSGIRARDGDTEIDITAGFAGQRDLTDNICGDFDKAIIHILYTGCSIFSGKSDQVLGDLIWYGNSFITGDMGHSGEGGGSRDMSSPFDDNRGIVS